jgi:hypothetical protein
VPSTYSLGFRFSFFEGQGPDAVLTAFGIDPDDAEPLTREATAEEFGVDRGTYRVGSTDGWGFALEEFGGDHTRALRKLSAGGRAVSVTRVEDGTSSFEYHRDGERTCLFEPLFPSRRLGPDADRFVDAMRRVGLDPDGRPNLALIAPAVAALDLVTDLFGVRLSAETVDGVLLTGAVEPGLAWLEG